MKKILILIASCGYTTIHAQSLNTSFENWHTIIDNGSTYEAPDNWYGIDSFFNNLSVPFFGTQYAVSKCVFKTTDAHSGTSAVLLKNIINPIDSSSLIPGILSNAIIDTSVGAIAKIKGGFPVNYRADSLTAWLKWNGFPNDTCTITIYAFKNVGGTDILVGGSLNLFVANKLNYTKIKLPIVYTTADVPDKIGIIIENGNDAEWEYKSTTETYIDDIQISNPLGIAQSLLNKQLIQTYQNANGTVNINVSEKIEDPLFYKLFNSNGTLIYETKIHSGNNIINIAQFPSGIYIQNVSNSKSGNYLSEKIKL